MADFLVNKPQLASFCETPSSRTPPPPFLERRKGHTHKGHREKLLKVTKFRIFSGYFQGVFRVFSGSFQSIFREFFRVFSGSFRVFFPMPFRVCPLDPFNIRFPNCFLGVESKFVFFAAFIEPPQDTFEHDMGTEICNFGAFSPLDFFMFSSGLPVDFSGL